MAETRGPNGPEDDLAAAVDAAASALLSLWDEAAELATAQLSASQLRALMVVEQHDGVNLRRLAAMLDMLLSSASRLCDRLVAAGVLERESGRYDRREISLHLTGAGRTLLDRLRAGRRERLAAVLARMSSGGRQALLRGLWEFGAVRSAEAAEETARRAAGDGSATAAGA